MIISLLRGLQAWRICPALSLGLGFDLPSLLHELIALATRAHSHRFGAKKLRAIDKDLWRILLS